MPLPGAVAKLRHASDSCLLAAKLATVAVPLVFKDIIDGLNTAQQALSLPVLLLLLYGALRFSGALFTELREILFARVTQRAVRRISLEVFRHLHELSLRFHLHRETGGVSRDIERGSRSISNLISYTLYSILPTLIEIGLVLAILFARYDSVFVLIALTSLTIYVVFTVKVSNWRISIRRKVNETDSAANTRAIDSLINYETVKYFNNEEYEAGRYDQRMREWEDAATRSRVSLSWLNLGQQLSIAMGVTAMMWRAASGVVDGSMTIGDLVLVNAFLIQLYMPLNFLGVVYREIRQALTDIERMFDLLAVSREVADAPTAVELAAGPVFIRFSEVDFSYEANRQILHAVDFSVPAGGTVASLGDETETGNLSADTPAPLPVADDAAHAPLDEELAEIDFLIESGLIDDARELIRELRTVHPEHPGLAERAGRLENASPFDVDDDFLSGLTDGFDLDFDEVKGAELSDLRDDEADTHFDLGLAFKDMAFPVYNRRAYAEKRLHSRAGLQRMARQRCDHMSARFRLPPRINDRAALFTDYVVIPYPGFVVDRLTNRAENPQRAPRRLFHRGIAFTQERPDRRRGRVENIDFVLVNNLPKTRPVRIVRDAFENY